MGINISFEGKVGIGLACVGLFGGGAVMVKPDIPWLGWTLIVLSLVGGTALALHHFGVWGNNSNEKTLAVKIIVSFLVCFVFLLVSVAALLLLSNSTAPIDHVQNLDDASLLPEINKTFEAIYASHQDELGKPIELARKNLRYDSYEASFERGLILWTNSYLSQIVMTKNSNDQAKFSIIPDNMTGPGWFNRARIHKLLHTRVGDEPIGGTARMISEHPNLGKKIGSLIWHCYLSGKPVFSQMFEHGIMIGPLRASNRLENSLVVTLVFDNSSHSNGHYYYDGLDIDPPICKSPWPN